MVYPDGREVSIPSDSVDEAFKARVADFIRKMVSDTPARRVPSLSECAWRHLTTADCSDRMEPVVA